tara:strand:+ start:158 stop:343 length:186 start_codon:yes stop_codon:yes gene_type:complete
MNKLLNVLKSLAVKMILGQKDKIIANMNKKIDVPFMNEKDEAELLEGVWEVVEEAVKEAAK